MIGSCSSIRDISKALHHLGLVFASLRADRKSFHLAAIIGLLLRTIWPHLYTKFCQNQITDSELIEAVFSQPEMLEIREGNEGTLFEMAIISAFLEIGTGESLLLEHYRNRATEGDDYRSHRIANDIKFLRRAYGFKHAVDRIELLSVDLIEATAGP